MTIYSTTEVAYSYAKDAETVRCDLQIMMCLWRLCMETGRPLLPADARIPKYVSAWNIQKGPIEDMSHALQLAYHHLEKSREFVGNKGMFGDVVFG